jgi:hypothetical protein
MAVVEAVTEVAEARARSCLLGTVLKLKVPTTATMSATTTAQLWLMRR